MFADNERLYIIANGIFVMRLVHNVFEPKASRVLRCLLVNIDREWTIREIAKETSISVGYTHAVVSTLLKLRYINRNDKHKLAVINPATLLKRWAAFHQYDYINSFLEYYTFEKELDVFLTKIEKKIANEKYALTSLTGAWLVSPYVRPIDIHFYVENKNRAKELAKLLNIKPTAGVGNVRIVIPYDKGVFYGLKSIRGIKVVSNVQLFVDLFNYPARGEEAAQNLYNIMEKEWSQVLIGGSNVR